MLSCRQFLASILVLLPSSGAVAATGPWQTNDHSQVRLITPYAVAPRAGKVLLGVEFKLQPGWHAYWKNSGDAGFPPKFDFAKTPGLRNARTLWPAPHRFEMPGGLQAFGYADEVIYPVEGEIAAPAGSTLRLTADVDYLVCAEECVPYRYMLSTDQPLGDAATEDAADAVLLQTWLSRVPVSAEKIGWRVEAAVERAGTTRWELRLALLQVHALEGLDLFFEPHDLFEVGRPIGSPAGTGTSFTIPLSRKNSSAALPAQTSFAWTLTGLRSAGASASVEGRNLVALPAYSKTNIMAGAVAAIAGLTAMTIFLLRKHKQRS